MDQIFKKYILNFFTFLEWILFLGLFICSVIFTWNVFVKYNSKATIIGQFEEKITMRPTITICFTKDIWKIFSDFNMSYYVFDGLDEDINILEMGENYNGISTEEVSLQKIYTNYKGICYQLNFNNNNDEIFQNLLHQIKISSDLHELPTMEFYFASEQNTYGITYSDWRDGEVLRVDIKGRNFKTVDITAMKHVFLKSGSKCNDESFYECFGSKVTMANFSACSKPCIPATFPNNFIHPDCQVCKEWHKCEEFQCSSSIVNKIFNNLNRNPEACPRSCATLQYSGKVIYEKLDYYDNKTEALLEYKFAEPAYVKVNNEYLIFDTIGMIGSVGGTLGLFIGLSFSNILAILIGYLKTFILYLDSR